MDPYIKSLADEIVNRYLSHQISDENKLITKVKDELYTVNSDTDKLGFLTIILEGNEQAYQLHLNDCTNGPECITNKKHERVNYFLRQELDEFGIIKNDNFTREEKEKCNDKLDEILQTIINTGEILDDKIEVLRVEIEELKSFYVLGKKNWRQQFVGKLADMVSSGVISELTAKPIIDNLLKPGADFIAKQLLM